MPELGEPFCNHCGYALKGAVEAAKCPECGRPLVEVLERRPTQNTQDYRRYRSERTFLGWPLVDIAFGADPGEKAGRARGIIARGDDAVGLIACGSVAKGFVAIGGVAIGVVSLGAVAVGIVAVGGFVFGGLLGFGGVAVSGHTAYGGLGLAHAGKAAKFIPIW